MTKAGLGISSDVEVDGLLLAAGAGRRAGGPKALRTDRVGRPWVQHGVEVLLAAGCRRVHVVVGAAGDEVAALLLDDDRVVVVRCPGWSRGIGASLRAGLATVDPVTTDAVLVHLVDLPDVEARVAARLVARAGRKALARATYGGQPGHPVLVGADHWPALVRALHDGYGARTHLREQGVDAVECGDLATGHDVDGPVGTRSEAPGA